MMRNLDIVIQAAASQQWSCGAEAENVLPFYQYSYEVLNPGHAYESCYNYQNDVRTKLCELLRTLCPNGASEHYFDLRSWDDFSCAAPQYLTLHELGWNHTSPLAFRVNGYADLPQLLELASAILQPGEKAALTLLERTDTQYRLLGLLLGKCFRDSAPSRFLNTGD